MTRLLVSVTLLLALVACMDTGPTLTESDQARVAEVQAVYDRDFRAAVAADGLDVSAGRFDRTLAALPPDSARQSGAVDGFYSLLEGLVYLQTGELGKAQAIAPEIAAAASALNTDGIQRRNAILATNFADMVEGREAVASLAKLTGNSAAEQARRVQIVRVIETGASSSTRRLCRAQTGSADQGAAFVAAYQATFLVEADRALARACVPFITDAAACEGFLDSRQQLQDARALMAAFGGPLAGSSQIASTRRAIERDLVASQDGAPLAAPANPCS